MYARKYYLIIYRRNLLPEYSRTSQQPIVFLCKVTFDLLTFLPFAAYIIFIKFTSFTIHLVHHSLFHFHFFTFTFSLSLFHLFLSIFSPFPFPFPFYLTHHSFLSTSQHPGQRLKKNGTTLSFLAKMY